MEVQGMVTRDRGGTSGGLQDDGQRTDYLQLAWLLREKLSDLVDGDKGEFPESGLRSLLDMATSHNIVSVDPEMMNPVLWRTLPKQLLFYVLALLPLPDITRLRCLSRQWRRDMATRNSEINLFCDEASPSMVALLSHSSTDALLVTIFDITKCRWQSSYHLHLRGPSDDDSQKWLQTWTAVHACDGGLACFHSPWIPTRSNPLCIVVVNLLTRVQHELPPLHHQYMVLPAMMQIQVDTRTKCYQVVVAGYKRGGITVETYDSGTRQWTKASPACVSTLGPVYKWTSMNGLCHKLSTTPGAYNFAEGKLEIYSKRNPSAAEFVVDWVLQKDHMFVVKKQPHVDTSHPGMLHRIFCITEHHFVKETKNWVQEKSYECPGFLEELTVEEVSDMCLHACDGFLMLIVYHGGRSDPYLWLLDLSTSEWSSLPENSNSKGLQKAGSVLCRAVWNVVP